jgi:hypothetical protein
VIVHFQLNKAGIVMKTALISSVYRKSLKMMQPNGIFFFLDFEMMQPNGIFAFFCFFGLR